jgi:hypothetical protein
MLIDCLLFTSYLSDEEITWREGLLAVAVVLLAGVIFNRLAARARKEHRRRKRPRNQKVKVDRIRGGHRLKRN